MTKRSIIGLNSNSYTKRLKVKLYGKWVDTKPLIINNINKSILIYKNNFRLITYSDPKICIPYTTHNYTNYNKVFGVSKLLITSMLNYLINTSTLNTSTYYYILKTSTLNYRLKTSTINYIVILLLVIQIFYKQICILEWVFKYTDSYIT